MPASLTQPASSGPGEGEHLSFLVFKKTLQCAAWVESYQEGPLSFQSSDSHFQNSLFSNVLWFYDLISLPLPQSPGPAFPGWSWLGLEFNHLLGGRAWLPRGGLFAPCEAIRFIYGF